LILKNFSTQKFFKPLHQIRKAWIPLANILSNSNLTARIYQFPNSFTSSFFVEELNWDPIKVNVEKWAN
jgi:hypothetical protein